MFLGKTLASLTPAGMTTCISNPGSFWRLSRDSNVGAVYLGDAVLTNKELAKMIINGSHELLELNILRGVRKASSRVYILAFDRANFGLLRELGNGIFLEAAWLCQG